MGTGANKVPVLVVLDSAGATADFILERLDGAHVSKALKPIVNPDAYLCTDDPRSISSSLEQQV